MVNGYTFRGRNSVIFVVAPPPPPPPPSSPCLFIKERIFSHRSKLVEPILGRLPLAGKQTESHQNCLPLKTCQKKLEVYPYTLKHQQTRLQNFISYSKKRYCLTSSGALEALWIKHWPADLAVPNLSPA